jgi:steroid delta-isomerase-like uncharacterized protein
MSSRSVRDIMASYVDSDEPEAFFAPDAVFTVEPFSRPFVGREGVAEMLKLFYDRAFSDARPEIVAVAADEEQRLGFLEFIFHGCHVGELMGFPPTGRTVAIPMMAIYQVDGDQIRKARLYFNGMHLHPAAPL